MMDEYLLTKQIGDVKDTITDLCEVHHIPKTVVAGHMILYGYTKKPSEFRTISALMLQLFKEGILFDKELEETY